jgi:Ca2+:H+ antiporter
MRMFWLAGLGVAATVILEYSHSSAAAIFAVSALGLIPLAGVLGKATEQVALHQGPGLGGLLNATFGNATELILAALALREGLVDVVEASITGSIIGNLLLVLGLAVFCGGLRFKSLRFNPATAGMATSTMTLAVLGLIVPAVYAVVPHASRGIPGPEILRHLSLGVAGVLLAVYLLGLLFSLRTHRDIFQPADATEEVESPEWTLGKALVIMLAATGLVVLQSEILVGTLQELLNSVPIPPIFLGAIVLAVVGNAAEHGVAVVVAMRGQMDLAFQIACGSSTQVALFVAPVLVFYSLFTEHFLDLQFTLLEVLAVGISAVIVGIISADGEFNWFEGAQLLGVYAILALAFFWY